MRFDLISSEMQFGPVTPVMRKLNRKWEAVLVKILVRQLDGTLKTIDNLMCVLAVFLQDIWHVILYIISSFADIGILPRL